MQVLVGRRAARVLLAFVVALLVVLAGDSLAPSALAAPSDTMDLVELQSRLDENEGVLQAYFKTVFEGDAIVEVPARVRSIVPRMTQDGALILFEANSDQISALGGIAQGMSGSPLYVKDGSGPDRLIGAVSYGDLFTLGGLGLATPIEYMVAIEDAYLRDLSPAPPALRSAVLDQPVRLDDETVKRVVVAPSIAEGSTIAAAEGTVVFAPLSAVQIGGLNPRTATYKALAGGLERKGFNVVSSAAGTSAGYDPAWSTSLTGGSSLGALYCRGDLWVGAAGTVTYVDGPRLLAFGHPLNWLGETENYLTNAWVSAIWGNAAAPYKLMAPAMLRGTILQDRNSGVAGLVGQIPEDSLITSSATLGGRTLTSASTMPRSLASDSMFADIAAAAAAVPVYQVVDAWSFPGSATTVSTVVVNDGVQDYTVKRTNVFDDAYDVSVESTDDLYMMLAALTADPDGVAPVTVRSVNFEGEYSPSRASARILSVSVPSGLKTGVNDVHVTLAVHGMPALQTEHVMLTIPEGTRLRGYLSVHGVGDSRRDDGMSSPSSPGLRDVANEDDRLTVSQIVAVLNESPTNNEVVVTYQPDSSSPWSEEPAGSARTATKWKVTGGIELPTSVLRVSADQKKLEYGRGTTLRGTIETPMATTAVAIYATPQGSSSATHLATVPAVLLGPVAVFEHRVTNVKKTTRYSAVWAGDRESLGSAGSVLITVTPKVTLVSSRATVNSGGTVTLSARALPAKAGRSLAFERRNASGQWIVMKRVATDGSGAAILKLRLATRGKHAVRASVAGGRSPVVTIVVK